MMKWFGLCLVSTLLLSALASQVDAGMRLTESGTLSSLEAIVIRPHLAAAADTAQKLSDSVSRMCETKDAASFSEARGAWKNANAAWLKTAPFRFGPAAGLERRLDKPVHDIVLEASVNDVAMKHLWKNQDARGYSAAEYLLFTPPNVAAATSVARCEHMKDVTAEIAHLTNQVNREWNSGYGKEFVAAGDGKPFLVAGDVLSLVLASMLNGTETLLRDGIGIPGGLFGSDEKPKLLRGWYSDTCGESFLASLDGLDQALSAGKSSSVLELAATRNGVLYCGDPKLVAGIRKQITKTRKVIGSAADKGLMRNAEPKKRKQALGSVYKEFQKLQDQLVELSLILELDVRTTDEKQ